VTILDQQRSGEPLSLVELLGGDLRADPYPFYAQLRDRDPVHWDDAMGFWMLARHKDISAVYADERFSRAQGLAHGLDRLPEAARARAEPLYQSFSKTMFYADPPYHTHLRGLVNSAFTPHRVARLRPYIQRLADHLLEPLRAREQIDLIRDFAYPLPVMVIAELLGLPAGEREKFKAWSDDVFAILGTVRQSPELMERARQSLAEMTEFITRLSAERRQDPRDDLLSGLLSVTAEDGAACPHIHAAGDPRGDSGQPPHAHAHGGLTQDELVANINILLSTGHETTTHLIGNGLLALLQHPEQLELLRAHPELMDASIEEMMRFDNPVQITYRAARADVEIGGRTIREGQLVNSIIASGNRDPERFPDPDRFDITRSPGRNLSFGLGIHFCIGASLVRLEAEIAFQSLLRHFPHMQLGDAELDWQDHPVFRGLRSLPLYLH
jgi:cytochrome P450